MTYTGRLSTLFLRAEACRIGRDEWGGDLDFIQAVPAALVAGRHHAGALFVGDGAGALYRLYLGVADGMSIARVWACQYSK